MEYSTTSTIFYYAVYVPAAFLIPMNYALYVLFDVLYHNLLPPRGKRRLISFYFFSVYMVDQKIFILNDKAILLSFALWLTRVRLLNSVVQGLRQDLIFLHLETRLKLKPTRSRLGRLSNPVSLVIKETTR